LKTTPKNPPVPEIIKWWVISEVGKVEKEGRFLSNTGITEKIASLLDRGEKKGYSYLVSCKEFWFGMKQAAWLFKLMRFSY